jgi:2'-5' RNA ligase
MVVMWEVRLALRLLQTELEQMLLEHQMVSMLDGRSEQMKMVEQLVLW